MNDSILTKWMVYRIQEECVEIMRNDIAIVNIRLASDKYTKTIIDKKLTFGDKLSSFGKIKKYSFRNGFYLSFSLLQVEHLAFSLE